MDTSNCFLYLFGEQKWPQSEQISNSHQFTGKEWDTDMSLNYFCQRYYDPSIGRFMTLDPIAGYLEEPQSQNRYAYCLNNPLKYVDPVGLVVVEAGFDRSGRGTEDNPLGMCGSSVTAARPPRPLGPPHPASAPGRMRIGDLPGQDYTTRGRGSASGGLAQAGPGAYVGMDAGAWSRFGGYSAIPDAVSYGLHGMPYVTPRVILDDYPIERRDAVEEQIPLWEDEPGLIDVTDVTLAIFTLGSSMSAVRVPRLGGSGKTDLLIQWRFGRQTRFDIFRPYPHRFPHIHPWEKIGPR